MENLKRPDLKEGGLGGETYLNLGPVLAQSLANSTALSTASFLTTTPKEQEELYFLHNIPDLEARVFAQKLIELTGIPFTYFVSRYTQRLETLNKETNIDAAYLLWRIEEEGEDFDWPDYMGISLFHAYTGDILSENHHASTDFNNSGKKEWVDRLLHCDVMFDVGYKKKDEIWVKLDRKDLVVEEENPDFLIRTTILGYGPGRVNLIFRNTKALNDHIISFFFDDVIKLLALSGAESFDESLSVMSGVMKFVYDEKFALEVAKALDNTREIEDLQLLEHFYELLWNLSIDSEHSAQLRELRTKITDLRKLCKTD